VRGLRQYFADASGRSHPLRRRSGWQALAFGSAAITETRSSQPAGPGFPRWGTSLCGPLSGKHAVVASGGRNGSQPVLLNPRAQESLRSNQRPLRSATGKEMVTSTVGLPPTSLADENPLAGTEPLRRTTGCPAGVGLGCPSPSKPWSPPWGNAWTGSRRGSATSACFSRPTSAPPRQWQKQSRQPPSKTPSGWSAGTSSSPSCTWPHSTPSSTRAARFLAPGVRGSTGPAPAASRPARHQRPCQLRPAASPAGRHQQRRFHRSHTHAAAPP